MDNTVREFVETFERLATLLGYHVWVGEERNGAFLTTVSGQDSAGVFAVPCAVSCQMIKAYQSGPARMAEMLVLRVDADIRRRIVEAART